MALPPDGLALAGVGYNLEELAVYRDMPTNPRTLKKLDERVARWLAAEKR